MTNLGAHLVLLRPLNLLTSALAMVVCASILNGLYDIKTLLILIFVVMCFNGGANTYNDVVDVQTDGINRPKRPLVTGAVKMKTAIFMAASLFLIGSTLTFELNWMAQFIALFIVLPLLIFYSKFLKGTPLIGNITIAAILGLSFIFAGAAFDNIGAMIVPAGLAFGLTFVRELIKDVADIKGDTEADLNTFPIRNGLINTAWVVIASSLLIGVSAIIPYMNGYYGLPYLIILILGVEIPLAIIVFSFYKEPTVSQAKRFSGVLKISTIVGLIAFFIDNYVR